MSDELIAEKEAAKVLHRHPVTLRKARRDGNLPVPYLKIGGRYFYRRSTLEAFLVACEVRPGEVA